MKVFMEIPKPAQIGEMYCKAPKKGQEINIHIDFVTALVIYF